MIKIEDIQNHGGSCKGRQDLIAHLEGKPLCASKALKAKCYDCMGFFADGRIDCAMPDCPLYPFMIYNPNKSKRRTKTFSEEQKANLSERMSKMRRSRS